MKKCVIFFTVLIIAIMVAILTEDNETVLLEDEVAMGESEVNNLLVQEGALSVD